MKRFQMELTQMDNQLKQSANEVQSLRVVSQTVHGRPLIGKQPLCLPQLLA